MRQPINDDIPVSFPISKESERLAGSYRTTRDKFNADLEAWQTEAESLRGVPEASWSPTHDEAATRLRATERELVVREIQIRESLDGLLSQVREADKPIAVESANQSYLKAKDIVRKQLQKIGYVEFLPSGHPSLTENMIERHPAVAAAWQLHQSYRDNDVVPNQQVNARSLGECRKALSAYKSRALAGMAV